MAMACNPILLIADEPTTALDVTIQAQILELMRELTKKSNTAILYITHDLAVIAEICQRVAVMYAGNVVETATVEALFAEPRHPYTKGLLASIPQFEDRRKRLDTIAGNVPDLIEPPSGCRFHPRCPYRMDICDKAFPPTYALGGGHTVACYLFKGKPEVN
jgi:peptide/nickel transport system ATP-binding protein